eukprot:g6668.t1
MGDLPREIEKRGRALAYRFLTASGFEARWISETSADIAIRPRSGRGAKGGAQDRFLRVQLKYSENNYGGWLRFLKSSLNSDRSKYHDMVVLAMSSQKAGQGCTVEVHQARPIGSAELAAESWKPLKEVASSLRAAYDHGKGHTSAQLEMTTITSQGRYVEQAMREQFWTRMKGGSLKLAGDGGDEYGAADWSARIDGVRRALRVQEKVLKVKKKNGKVLGLRADLVRYANLIKIYHTMLMRCGTMLMR